MLKSVFIVEDHQFVIDAISELVRNEKGLTFSGYAKDYETALSQIEIIQPSLVIVDINLKNSLSGFYLIKEITKKYPRIRKIVLSMYDEEVYISKAIKAGANAYVSKSEGQDSLLKAIELSFTNSYYLCGKIIIETEKEKKEKKKKSKNHIQLLSKREYEIFQLLGQAKKPAEISELLNLSVKTVGCHLENIKRKLQISNMTKLIKHASKNY